MGIGANKGGNPMVKVKSNSPQPLYLNLTGGKTMKIRARATAEVSEEDLHSLELSFHQSRGNVVVLEQPRAVQAPKAKEKGSVVAVEEAGKKTETKAAGEGTEEGKEKEAEKGRKGGR
jgi:hypothetical protein